MATIIKPDEERPAIAPRENVVFVSDFEKDTEEKILRDLSVIELLLSITTRSGLEPNFLFLTVIIGLSFKIVPDPVKMA